MLNPEIWDIEPIQIEHVHDMIKEYRIGELYQERLQRNVRGQNLDLSRENYWEKLVGCVITSRQRSGRGSRVHKFMHQDEFPLHLDQWPTDNRTDFAQETLADHGLPGKKNGTYIAENYDWFRMGGDEFLMRVGNDLQAVRSDDWKTQIYREAAAALATKAFFDGIGPKQSRNYWQWLGLFQYEIPLDSRILNWIKDVPPTHPMVQVEHNELGDEKTYREVMNWIQALCKQADVLPCLLDAAVFSSRQNLQ